MSDQVSDIREMTAGSPIDIEVTSTRMQGRGTVESYNTNIAAIRNAAAMARGEAI